MSTRLYVGGLAYDTDIEGLRQMFEPSGTVDSAIVATDRGTGRSKGFGFVEMSNDEEAQAAIVSLHGKMLGSRSLRVEIAKLPQRAGEAPSR